MPSEREKMESWSEKKVLDSMSNSPPGSPIHTRATAEIQRRMMGANQASLEAQQKSADAASDAARSSKLSARYTKFALIVAALSVAVSLAVGIAAIFRK